MADTDHRDYHRTGGVAPPAHHGGTRSTARPEVVLEWLPFVLVVASLLGSVLVPALLERQRDRLQDEIADLVDPARLQVARLRAGLAAGLVPNANEFAEVEAAVLSG